MKLNYYYLRIKINYGVWELNIKAIPTKDSEYSGFGRYLLITFWRLYPQYKLLFSTPDPRF